MLALLFVLLIATLASQLLGSIFGFWKNKNTNNATLEGLPSYISYEMVAAALSCQESWGHPAACTLAQIIVESGSGEQLSGLAQRDNNLFGIKWSSEFAACPEVSGKDFWQTQEEYNGHSATIMASFTKFTSFEACIQFRSRVLLQSSRYANNALIQQAISTRSSDTMAEGLKDAGYATDSSYVASLKAVMQTYSLYRFDAITLEDFEGGQASGSTVVEAAHTQLGTPYVWGGTTAYVGLDCSGLTQWCYAQAGKQIPRNSEDQADAGTKIPLSDAKPGDILWRYGHVAIYIGGDSYIHAPRPGRTVSIDTGISQFSCAIRF
jgi:cell wall-associated NlpC family hydrolase